MRNCGVKATLDFIFAYEFRLVNQFVDEKSLCCTWERGMSNETDGMVEGI